MKIKNYKGANEMEKPTEKQMDFIKIIEEEWGEKPFTGTSKKEAAQYISQKVPSFLGGDCDDK